MAKLKVRKDMIENILKDRCVYLPNTGDIVWRSDLGKAKEGARAVFFSKKTGYGSLRVKHQGIRYTFMAHRVAWLLHTGEWPKGVVDHIDNNPSNNAISNLRDCSQSHNLARRRMKEKKLPRGVTYVHNNKKNPYVAQFRCKHVGYFPTPELASQAYELAFEKEFGKEWRN